MYKGQFCHNTIIEIETSMTIELKIVVDTLRSSNSYVDPEVKIEKKKLTSFISQSFFPKMVSRNPYVAR